MRRTAFPAAELALRAQTHAQALIGAGLPHLLKLDLDRDLWPPGTRSLEC